MDHPPKYMRLLSLGNPNDGGIQFWGFSQKRIFAPPPTPQKVCENKILLFCKYVDTLGESASGKGPGGPKS